MKSFVTILLAIIICSIAPISIAQSSDTATITLLKQGRLQYEQGEYQNAFGNFKKALETDSTNTEALYYLGSTSIKLQASDNAEKIYAAMQQVAPGHELTSRLSDDIDNMRAVARYDAYFEDVSAEHNRAEAELAVKAREYQEARAEAESYSSISGRLDSAREENLARLRRATRNLEDNLAKLKRKRYSSSRPVQSAPTPNEEYKYGNKTRGKMSQGDYKRMRKKVEARHPDDYNTQKFVIDRNVKAYNDLHK